MFAALEYSHTVMDRMAAVEAKVRRHRKSLADQLARAAESITLNLAEGRHRTGLDRADFYRRAAGSAGELTAALRIAVARGYITRADFAAVDDPLDHVRAITWSLTHVPPPEPA
jgi:four helix bundle protein